MKRAAATVVVILAAAAFLAAEVESNDTARSVSPAVSGLSAGAVQAGPDASTTSSAPMGAAGVAGVAPASPPPERGQTRSVLHGTLFLGDSVMLGARPWLRHLPGRVDAVESRRVYAGISIVRHLAHSGRLPGTVVMGLGTNGQFPGYACRELHSALGGSRRLLLVTVRVPRSWTAADNRVIETCAQRYRMCRWFPGAPSRDTTRPCSPRTDTTCQLAGASCTPGWSDPSCRGRSCDVRPRDRRRLVARRGPPRGGGSGRGRLPDFPHLPELPGRGPWADVTGRGLAVVDGLFGELTVSGWRLVTRPGRDAGRARSLLAHDLDVLEERLSGYSGWVKLQVAGPITMAATVELRSGHAAVTDEGARRDIAQSLAQGVTEHIADVHRRLPQADVVMQLDEPALAICLAGEMPTASGFSRVRPVPAAEAQQWLALSLAAAADDAPATTPVVHCCDARPPVGLLVAAGARGLSLDLTALEAGLEPGLDDDLGHALESGVTLFAGAVDGLAPVSDPATSVHLVRTLTSRWGLPPSRVAEQVVVTPTCGLAGALPDEAAGTYRLVNEVARRLRDEPEASS